jgi:hypothetical protein
MEESAVWRGFCNSDELIYSAGINLLLQLSRLDKFLTNGGGGDHPTIETKNPLESSAFAMQG